MARLATKQEIIALELAEGEGASGVAVGLDHLARATAIMALARRQERRDRPDDLPEWRILDV